MRNVVVSIVLCIGVIFSVGYGLQQQGKARDFEEQYKQSVQENKEKCKKLMQENESLQEKLNAKENNTEAKVKEDTEKFLQAFFTYDTSKGERGWTKIDPFTKEPARGKLKPAGESGEPEKTSSETTIISGVKETKLYYTPVSNTKANVFSRVWVNITVNGVTSTSQMLLDIQMEYDSNSNKWLVADIAIQQPLSEKGYIN